MRLVACPSCSELVRSIESRCPHCGTTRETVTAPLPSLVLLGLALAGCPADDYREDLPQDPTTETSATTSSTMSASSTTVETTDSSGSTGTSTTTETTTFSDEAAYGVPETESFTETSTSSSGTDSSGTGADSTGTDSTGTDSSGTDSSTTD